MAENTFTLIILKPALSGIPPVSTVSPNLANRFLTSMKREVLSSVNSSLPISTVPVLGIPADELSRAARAPASAQVNMLDLSWDSLLYWPEDAAPTMLSEGLITQYILNAVFMGSGQEKLLAVVVFISGVPCRLPAFSA